MSDIESIMQFGNISREEAYSLLKEYDGNLENILIYLFNKDCPNEESKIKKHQYRQKEVEEINSTSEKLYINTGLGDNSKPVYYYNSNDKYLDKLNQISNKTPFSINPNATETEISNVINNCLKLEEEYCLKLEEEYKDLKPTLFNENIKKVNMSSCFLYMNDLN